MEAPRVDDAVRTQSEPALRRRVPAWAVVLAGAVVATAYGMLVARMSLGGPLVVLGLGGVALSAAALTFYRMVAPLLHSDAESAAAPPAPARRRDLERDKQAVLKAIREIELDYQMRKISEPDWRELSQRYRARAMRIIRELDAGDDFRGLIEQELKARLASEKE